MQDNYLPPAHNVPPKALKQGQYTIVEDQMPLFDIPPQKPENSAFQAVYGANSHRATIQKATKIIKNHKKS